MLLGESQLRLPFLPMRLGKDLHVDCLNALNVVACSTALLERRVPSKHAARVLPKVAVSSEGSRPLSPGLKWQLLAENLLAEQSV